MVNRAGGQWMRGTAFVCPLGVFYLNPCRLALRRFDWRYRVINVLAVPLRHCVSTVRHRALLDSNVATFYPDSILATFPPSLVTWTARPQPPFEASRQGEFDLGPRTPLQHIMARPSGTSLGTDGRPNLLSLPKKEEWPERFPVL